MYTPLYIVTPFEYADQTQLIKQLLFKSRANKRRIHMTVRCNGVKEFKQIHTIPALRFLRSHLTPLFSDPITGTCIGRNTDWFFNQYAVTPGIGLYWQRPGPISHAQKPRTALEIYHIRMQIFILILDGMTNQRLRIMNKKRLPKHLTMCIRNWFVTHLAIQNPYCLRILKRIILR